MSLEEDAVAAPPRLDLAAIATSSTVHHLLVRRPVTGGELAFFTCHAPAGTTLAELVQVAGTRWRSRNASRHLALEALGAEASRSLYVGDSVRYDVMGAQAAGLHPVHLDPYKLCDGIHSHVAALAELTEVLVGG